MPTGLASSCLPFQFSQASLEALESRFKVGWWMRIAVSGALYMVTGQIRQALRDSGHEFGRLIRYQAHGAHALVGLPRAEDEKARLRMRRDPDRTTLAAQIHGPPSVRVQWQRIHPVRVWSARGQVNGRADVQTSRARTAKSTYP